MKNTLTWQPQLTSLSISEAMQSQQRAPLSPPHEQKGYPGPITRCFGCSRSRNLYFKRQRQGSSPLNAAGGEAIPESTGAERAGVEAGTRRTATDAHAGDGSGGTNTAYLSGTVADNTDPAHPRRRWRTPRDPRPTTPVTATAARPTSRWPRTRGNRTPR